jgi:transposase
VIKFTLVKNNGRRFEMDKLMSHKEANRAQVLGLLEENAISRKEAAKRLGVTARQVRRIAKRYRAEGLSGLVSKKRGMPSNRRLDESTRLVAIEVIGKHYRDFVPTLASEKLKEQHQCCLQELSPPCCAVRLPSLLTMPQPRALCGKSRNLERRAHTPVPGIRFCALQWRPPCVIPWVICGESQCIKCCSVCQIII